MVLVVGMLETYTDPNPEIIDDVSRDFEAYHLDIKYIHECAVAALDGKGERQAPSFYTSGSTPSSRSTSPPARRIAAA